MSDGTKIEWTDATWNVVNGCSVTSPGCTNCYAMRLAGTRLKHHPSRAGLTIDSKAGPVWTGETRFNDKVLLDPLRWKRPRRIFVCAHGDLFHDSVPDEWIDRVFAVMALAPQHQFQVLTKRAARMREHLTNDGLAQRIHDQKMLVTGLCDPDWKWPLPNVWLGVSVEDQARADERIPDLLATPAAVRWISAEPLLGPIDLSAIPIAPPLPGEAVIPTFNSLEVSPLLSAYGIVTRKLDWVVAGGESGPGARPMHPDWARSLRDQCAGAGVPFLFKQWGAFKPTSDAEGEYMMPCSKREAGRLLDGIQHDGFPA